MERLGERHGRLRREGGGEAMWKQSRYNEMTSMRFLGRQVTGAGVKQGDMDKRSAAESRDVGRSSQKIGNASDQEILQKTFNRMK